MKKLGGDANGVLFHSCFSTYCCYRLHNKHKKITAHISKVAVIF